MGEERQVAQEICYSSESIYGKIDDYHPKVESVILHPAFWASWQVEKGMLGTQDYSDTMKFPFLPSDPSDQVELRASRNRSFPSIHSLSVAISLLGFNNRSRAF